jgi:hypothetical protein
VAAAAVKKGTKAIPRDRRKAKDRPAFAWLRQSWHSPSTEAAALEVRCPVCGAGNGDRCRNPSEVVVKAHVDRIVRRFSAGGLAEQKGDPT